DLSTRVGARRVPRRWAVHHSAGAATSSIPLRQWQNSDSDHPSQEKWLSPVDCRAHLRERRHSTLVIPALSSEYKSHHPSGEVPTSAAAPITELILKTNVGLGEPSLFP